MGRVAPELPERSHITPTRGGRHRIRFGALAAPLGRVAIFAALALAVCVLVTLAHAIWKHPPF